MQENMSSGFQTRPCVNLYLIDTPFKAFANRTYLDQAALVRAA